MTLYLQHKESCFIIKFCRGKKIIDPQIKISGSNPLFKDTTLIDTLNQEHFLIILAKKINWDYLGGSLCKFYNESIGRKAVSLRVMIAIIILQYMLNLSYEDIV
jgi:hypothetical protein